MRRVLNRSNFLPRWLIYFENGNIVVFSCVSFLREKFSCWSIMDIAMIIGEVLPLGSSAPVAKNFICLTCKKNFICLTCKKNFICLTCKKTFPSSSNLYLHMKIHSNEKLFACDKCQKSFGRSSSLVRQLKTHNRKAVYITLWWILPSIYTEGCMIMM